MKGIVRSMKPNQIFFERTWESFYKLYLHMKYGQGSFNIYYSKLLILLTMILDQRVDMNGFEKIMEHFAETKYKAQFRTREKLVSEDDADEMYNYLVGFSN